VVEGEEDAAAAYHMLNAGRKTLHPVVWLNSASIPARSRDDIYGYLSSFETVKLAIEDDEAGKKVKELLGEMLPNKIREVQLTKHKDANDYLIAGDEQEFKSAWANAKVFTPDNIFHTEADIDAILEDAETETFVETSFDRLNEMIRGLLLNHVTLITGMEGLGKTELLRAFEYSLLKGEAPTAILHLEETKNKTVRGLCNYELGRNVRDTIDDKDDVKKAWSKLSDNHSNAFLFEFKNDPDINTFLEQVNYLVHVCGVRYLCIDPINQFDPVDDTTKVDFLDSLSKKLEKYCSKNPLGVIWTAHVDDEGRTRNSRMIAKACSIRIDLTRDHLSQDEDERNTLHLTVSKNRPFSETGYAGPVYFDKETFTIVDGKKTATPIFKEAEPPAAIVIEDDDSIGF
jgi:archaellum biogenesis ATPase FlaH